MHGHTHRHTQTVTVAATSPVPGAQFQLHDSLALAYTCTCRSSSRSLCCCSHLAHVWCFCCCRCIRFCCVWVITVLSSRILHARCGQPTHHQVAASCSQQQQQQTAARATWLAYRLTRPWSARVQAVWQGKAEAPIRDESKGQHNGAMLYFQQQHYSERLLFK